jgi:hypothetical protein
MPIKRSPEHLAALRDGLLTSPKSGPYASHSRAKQWRLTGPDGREYQFRNLALFVRERVAQFDTTLPNGSAMAYQGLLRLRPGHVHETVEFYGWRWSGERAYVNRKADKQYCLRAPDGTEHRFWSLRRFIDEHTDLFSPDDVTPYKHNGPSRAALRLSQLRPKPGNRHRSWKGWSWADV